MSAHTRVYPLVLLVGLVAGGGRICPDVDVTIGASVGVSTYPEHAQLGYDLLNLADQAIYLATRSGKNQFTIYTRTSEARTRQVYPKSAPTGFQSPVSNASSSATACLRRIRRMPAPSTSISAASGRVL